MTLVVLVRKELLEQLRTHRLTVVVALYLVFGLISPIMTKMLPEFLKVAAGDVPIPLPPPTAAAAIDQYFKNLTQMGLLIVVLIAMGAIAGERERGTAAMTLCKPVSRGAFIASKFVAYAVLLAIALIPTGVACYYYTLVLFEPLDPLAFVATNALLGLYLLVVLGLTLLSSALLRSPLAAGGLAMGFVILVSIMGAVPHVSAYAPGALLGWATALVADRPSGAAWPALATGLAIVAACGVGSWAVFRRQEL